MRIFTALVAASAALLTSTAAFAQDTYVRGHTRSDGTYVPQHYRTNPNNSTFDNYSTRGNVNPYTGERGTVDPNRPSGSYGSNSLGSPGYGSTGGFGTNRRGW